MVIKIPERLMDFVSQRQVEFNMSWSIFQYITPIISFETFAIVLCNKFDIVGEIAVFIYMGIPVISIVGLIILGRGLIQSGYQHKISKTTADLNKEWVEALGILRELKGRGEKK